ncbi:hypothetical protein HNR33_003323 [Brassicibacter mesophilus]
MYLLKSGVEHVSYSKPKIEAVYKICNYKIKLQFEIYKQKEVSIYERKNNASRKIHSYSIN